MTLEKKKPIRTCVSCRKASEKSGFMRVVRGSDGIVRIDRTGRESGRGAYLCRNEKCAAAALKGKRLDRALRTQVPADVYEELINLAKADKDKPAG